MKRPQSQVRGSRGQGARALAALALAVCASLAVAAGTPRKQVALIAGPATHAFGEHEHYAGLRLLGDLLNDHVPSLQVAVYRGWPEDAQALAGVAAVVLFADGGPDSLLVSHLPQLEPLMARGVGLGVMHWALDVPKGEPGNRLIEWIGGCYETNWSVNPKWTARFEKLPAHPMARGVRPFALEDEWYYHMRFREGMRGITPLLTAVPPDAAHEAPDGPHSGNPVVRARKGEPEHVAWACERAGGGRGFGFSGGHKQWNWAQDDCRKLVLNAIVWVAGADVPPDGVRTPRPNTTRLLQNFEKQVPKKINLPRFDRMLDDLNAPAEAEAASGAASSLWK